MDKEKCLICKKKLTANDNYSLCKRCKLLIKEKGIKYGSGGIMIGGVAYSIATGKLDKLVEIMDSFKDSNDMA